MSLLLRWQSHAEVWKAKASDISQSSHLLDHSELWQPKSLKYHRVHVVQRVPRWRTGKVFLICGNRVWSLLSAFPALPSSLTPPPSRTPFPSPPPSLTWASLESLSRRAIAVSRVSVCRRVGGVLEQTWLRPEATAKRPQVCHFFFFLLVQLFPSRGRGSQAGAAA